MEPLFTWANMQCCLELQHAEYHYHPHNLSFAKGVGLHVPLKLMVTIKDEAISFVEMRTWAKEGVVGTSIYHAGGKLRLVTAG